MAAVETERSLVVGALYGVRHFRFDALAGGTEKELRGPVSGVRWLPGEQHAICASQVTNAKRTLSDNTEWCDDGGIAKFRDNTNEAVIRQISRGNLNAASHRAGTAWCTCGFWGYWDKEHSSYINQPVIAVIKAWGVVSVGPYGFRGEKAQIIAIAPSSVAMSLAANRARWVNDFSSTAPGEAKKSVDWVDYLMDEITKGYVVLQDYAERKGDLALKVYRAEEEMFRAHPTSQWEEVQHL